MENSLYTCAGNLGLVARETGGGGEGVGRRRLLKWLDLVALRCLSPCYYYYYYYYTHRDARTHMDSHRTLVE
jgi:hypothetical protein